MAFRKRDKLKLKRRRNTFLAQQNHSTSTLTTTATKKIATNMEIDAKKDFWCLPREVRDIIYGYVLSTPFTKSPPQNLIPLSASQAKVLCDPMQAVQEARDEIARAVNKPGRTGWRSVTSLARSKLWEARFPAHPSAILLDMDILRTNTQAFVEVNEYIREFVVVQLDGQPRDLGRRQLSLLAEVQNLHFNYKARPFYNNKATAIESARYHQVLVSRKNLKILRIQLDWWHTEQSCSSPLFYSPRWVDDDVEFLESLTEVTALRELKLIDFGHRDDVPEEMAKDYKAAVKKLHAFEKE